MLQTNDYRKLYEELDAATPLTFDCGRLCGRACCHVDPELPGMYLFPGEEALFAGMEGFTISEAELPGYGAVLLLSCEGSCDRAVRPLSCRLFPLAPRVAADGVSARLDPRGRPICPLCQGSRAALSGQFIEAVERVLRALLADPDAAAFLRALSSRVDEYEAPMHPGLKW